MAAAGQQSKGQQSKGQQSMGQPGWGNQWDNQDQPPPYDAPQQQQQPPAQQPQPDAPQAQPVNYYIYISGNSVS